jgi:hypothetical protein
MLFGRPSYYYASLIAASGCSGRRGVPDGGKGVAGKGLRKMATKEEIRKAAIEMHDWMQQRAIAGLRRDLPARPRAKVGIPSEEREEIYRRFPHFTRKDYSALVTELQKLVKAALDQTKD